MVKSLLSHEETDVLLKKVERQIAEKTFDTSDGELIAQMVECMGDTRGLVRLGFAEALGAVGKPAVPFLLEALANHDNAVVRRAAAKTLTLIGDPTTVPNLIEALLHDEDTVVRSSAIGALARTGEAAVLPLLQILESKDSTETTKGHAAWALAFIGTEGKQHLYQAINSDSPEVRAAIVGAIAKIAEQEEEAKAFELIVQALNDPASNVRSEAAAVLGNLVYQPAVPQLIELLQHQEGETRKSAALALMKIGDRPAIEPIKAALARESEENVKRAMALAVSQLEKQLEEDDW
ncbi:MAG: HEAT repeat domain-containing protein [Xenococcaceae cyanobacterium]